MPTRVSKNVRSGTIAVELGLVGDFLALANRLHRMPHDPNGRKRVLLQTLAGAVDARGGVCVVAHDDGSTVPAVVSATHSEHVPQRSSHGRRRRAPRPAASERDPLVRRVVAHLFPKVPIHVQDEADEHALFSSVRLKQPGTVAAIALVRGPRESRPFKEADQAILDLVHAHMTWIYAQDLPLASPEVRQLPPRPQQTLQLLLAGNGEKQIASKLGLSHNTVHTYVKQLYRHFHVSSRTELLARWVRE